MGFDANRFKHTKFEIRTEEVSVPDLKDFFGEGEKPVWVVRGLTGKELGRVNEAEIKNKDTAAILEGLASGQDRDKINAIKGLLCLDGSMPPDVARRHEMLIIGSVEPPCDLDLAKKLGDCFPVEFFQLTHAIIRLTGQGKEVKKNVTPSGEIPPSEPVLPCATETSGFSLKPDPTSSPMVT